LLVTGGAKGADTHAAQLWREWGGLVEEHPVTAGSRTAALAAQGRPATPAWWSGSRPPAAPSWSSTCPAPNRAAPAPSPTTPTAPAAARTSPNGPGWSSSTTRHLPPPAAGSAPATDHADQPDGTLAGTASAGRPGAGHCGRPPTCTWVTGCYRSPGGPPRLMTHAAARVGRPAPAGQTPPVCARRPR
jgi:hypothetical protein